MKKSLIIAEKPSVAADIARALGGFEKKEHYFENDTYVVSSSIGHLLELCVPPEHDIQRGKWKLDNLPLIPPHFTLNAIKKTQERLQLLLKLIKRKDVDQLINACDAGREGELIFTYIVQYSGINKPVQRLWLQSMTKEAIRQGFHQLRSGESMQTLAEAARCRAESDWLVGINGTRAITAFNSREGGFQLTPVGRVKTPTLSILVEREKKIRAHIPQPYWEIQATLTTTDAADSPIIYQGHWFRPQFTKSEQQPDHTATRLWSAEEAAQIIQRCQGQTGQVSVEKKKTKQYAPSLFDLTTLQKEANKRFSFSAKYTLSVAQNLYEKLKLITYPRTDARYLPEDYIPTVRTIMQDIQQTHTGLWADLAPFAQHILSTHGIETAKKKVFNNDKISDHFAIIPTGAVPKELGEPERKIYLLIMKRFLAIFFPAAEYEVTTCITHIQGESFKTEGKILLALGWKTVYQQHEHDQEEEPLLPPITDGSTVRAQDLASEQSETKAPARMTEASLLSAMEHVGKWIEDSEQRAAIAHKGLGTPATRATIIEDLLKEDYVIRQNKELIPTAKAFSLMTLLHGLSIGELTSPEMTAEWEQNLARVEKGELARDQFMHAIRDITQKIVTQTKNYQSDTVPGNFVVLTTPCPRCGHTIKEQYQHFSCTHCDFTARKSIAGRIFDTKEMDLLLRTGQLGPLQGFRSKLGRAFEATLYFKEGQIVFDFSLEREAGIAIDETQSPLGQCPACGGRVFDSERFYVCEKAAQKEPTCTFKTGKIVLKKEILRSDVEQLLSTGTTNLLPNFISKKGRKFAAYLVITEEKKIGFAFQEKATGESGTKERATTKSSTRRTTKSAAASTSTRKKNATTTRTRRTTTSNTSANKTTKARTASTSSETTAAPKRRRTTKTSKTSEHEG